MESVQAVKPVGKPNEPIGENAGEEEKTHAI